MGSKLLVSPEQPENRFEILDEASLSLVRARIRELGAFQGLSDSNIAAAELIATELGQNQLRHATYGEISLEALIRAGNPGIEVRAADRGRGIVDPGQAILPRSTSESLHAGLSAVVNFSDELLIDDRVGEGLMVTAIRYEKRIKTALFAGVYARPIDEEPESGDDGYFSFTEDGFLLAVADGFGHGVLARDSSRLAMEVVAESRNIALEDLMMRIHSRLREMRGLMLCLVRFDIRTDTLEICGAGDISGVLRRKGSNFPIFFHSLPLGSRFRNSKPDQIRIPIEPGDLLVLHTDGVRESFDLGIDGLLERRQPVDIAARLVRESSRRTDDALAIVVRFSGDYRV